MWLRKISHYYLLLLVTILLVSCVGNTNSQSPTSIAGSDEATIINGEAAIIDIEIVNTIPELRVVKTESVEQPNCGGTDSIENAVNRARTITHTIEVGGGVTVNAEGSVGISGTNVQLGAAVAAHLNYSYGVEEILERSVIVKAASGSHMIHTIEQQEIWDVGEAVITINGEETTVPFSFRRDFAVQSINSINLGCPSGNVTPDGGVTISTEPPAEETSNPMLTMTSAPTNVPTPLPSSTIASFPSNFIEIEQIQASDWEDFSLTIRSIEFLPNGWMRWNLEYWNQSNDSGNVQINYDETYLADEYGNRYSVLGAKDGIGNGLNISIQAGVKVNHWVEFRAPIDGASQFIVNFVEFGSSGVANFPLFNVFLPYDTDSWGTQTPTPSSGNITLEINQIQASDWEDFSLTIRSIEFLPNGWMRWNLEYWNQSNDSGNVQINYDETYLADEYGNRYSILGAKDGIGNGLNISIQAGVKVNHWVEFRTPIDGASQFTTNFIEFGSSGVANFPLFDVFLSYDTDLFATQTPTPPSGNITLEINQIQASDWEDFSLTIRSIEFLPNGWMRWNLEYWNQSSDSGNVQIDYDETYLADEYGNRYSVLGAKDGIGNGLNISIQAGVKVNHWVEFRTPIDGASQFIVNFVEFGSSGVANFPLVNLHVDYDNNLFPTSTPTPFPIDIIAILTINETINSDWDNITLTIRSIEILPNERMRWNLEYWNQSNDSANVQIDYDETYLADEYGNQYSIIAANNGTGQGYNVVVEAGVKVYHWIEFPMPIDNAKNFVIEIIEFGSSGVANFDLFSILLPDY